MLAEVKAVVGAEDYVRVVELAGLLEGIDHVLDQVVDAQHALEPLAVQLVDRGDLRVVEQGTVLEPLRLGAHVRLVERRRARRLHIGERVGVARRRRRRLVRDVGRHVQEERFVVLLLDELARLPREDVDEVVLRGRAVPDELAVLVEPVVVLRVRVAAAGRTVPLVPAGRDERRVDGFRIPVQILAEQPRPVAGVVHPRGDRRLLVAVGMELSVPTRRREVAENVVLVHVLAAQDRRTRGATQRVGDEEVRERRPLLHELRVDLREPRRVEVGVEVEVVGEDEDDVRLLGRLGLRHRRAGRGRPRRGGQ